MHISQRIPRSEVYVYIIGLYKRGYRRVGVSPNKRGHILELERVTNGKREVVKVKFSANGWSRIY